MMRLEHREAHAGDPLSPRGDVWRGRGAGRPRVAARLPPHLGQGCGVEFLTSAARQRRRPRPRSYCCSTLRRRQPYRGCVFACSPWTGAPRGAAKVGGASATPPSPPLILLFGTMATPAVSLSRMRSQLWMLGRRQLLAHTQALPPFPAGGAGDGGGRDVGGGGPSYFVLVDMPACSHGHEPC